MQIQVRRHPNGHAREEPSLIVLEPLCRLIPEAKQHEALYDLDALPAATHELIRAALGMLDANLVQLGSLRVELCRYRADCRKEERRARTDHRGRVPLWVKAGKVRAAVMEEDLEELQHLL